MSAADGMPVRAWYHPHRDGLVHGIVWMTDEQALDRLTRGYDWRPVDGAAAVVASIAAGLAVESAA